MVGKSELSLQQTIPSGSPIPTTALSMAFGLGSLFDIEPAKTMHIKHNYCHSDVLLTIVSGVSFLIPAGERFFEHRAELGSE